MAKGHLYVEKRKEKRVEKKFEVTYNVVAESIIASQKDNEGKSQDISIGGARIEGKIVGKENDVVRILFKSGNKFIILFAFIKWVKDENGKGQFGIEFFPLREEERLTLEEIIND
jgi:hypothetical protein